MADQQRQQCSGTTRAGTPCAAVALPGSALCLFHDPARAAQRAAGRQRGGKARSRPAAVLPADTPDLPLDSVQDVVKLLGATINEVRRGRLDAKVGNTISCLSSTLLKALQDADLERRLSALEQRLAQQD